MEKNYGKEIIKEILEKEPRIWTYQELVKYASKLTNKNPRTIKNWLKYYWKHAEEEGIVYKKYEEASLLYAEKYKNEIEGDIENYKEEVKKEIKKQQDIIIEKMEELEDAFEYWLRYEIKIRLLTFEKDLYGLFIYRVGESEKLPLWKKLMEQIAKKQNLDLKEIKNFIYSSEIEDIIKEISKKSKIPLFIDEIRDYAYLGKELYPAIFDFLIYEENIIFLDAILNHPKKDIQKMAWKWFVYYKDKKE